MNNKTRQSIATRYPRLVKTIQKACNFTNEESVFCLQCFPGMGEELVEHTGGTRNVVARAFKARHYV